MKACPRGFPVLDHEMRFALRLSISVKEVCPRYVSYLPNEGASTRFPRSRARTKFHPVPLYLRKIGVWYLLNGGASTRFSRSRARTEFRPVPLYVRKLGMS